MRLLLLTKLHKNDKFEGIDDDKWNDSTGGIPLGQPQGFWVKALKELGHDIITVIYEEGLYPGLPLPTGIARFFMTHSRIARRLSSFATRNFNQKEFFLPIKEFNKKFAEITEELLPDVVLVSGGTNVLWPSTVRKLKGTGAILVYFNGMPPIIGATPTEKEYAHLMDFIFVNDPTHCLDWKLLGCKRVKAMPISAIDPDFHRPVIIQEEDRKKYGCDISFVGTLEWGACYGEERIRILEALRDFDLGIWSPDRATLEKYPELKRFYRGIARQSELGKVIGASKINLNIMARSMPGGGNLRTFEIPGFGGFQLCDKIQDNWFVNGKEIVRYGDVNDLREKIQYYLTHENERVSIASEGRKSALKTHKYTDRFTRIIDLIKKLKEGQDVKNSD